MYWIPGTLLGCTYFWPFVVICLWHIAQSWWRHVGTAICYCVAWKLSSIRRLANGPMNDLSPPDPLRPEPPHGRLWGGDKQRKGVVGLEQGVRGIKKGKKLNIRGNYSYINVFFSSSSSSWTRQTASMSDLKKCPSRFFVILRETKLWWWKKCHSWAWTPIARINYCQQANSNSAFATTFISLRERHVLGYFRLVLVHSLVNLVLWISFESERDSVNAYFFRLNGKILFFIVHS